MGDTVGKSTCRSTFSRLLVLTKLRSRPFVMHHHANNRLLTLRKCPSGSMSRSRQPSYRMTGASISVSETLPSSKWRDRRLGLLGIFRAICMMFSDIHPCFYRNQIQSKQKVPRRGREVFSFRSDTAATWQCVNRLCLASAQNVQVYRREYSVPSPRLAIRSSGTWPRLFRRYSRGFVSARLFTYWIKLTWCCHREPSTHRVYSGRRTTIHLHVPAL